MHRIVAFCILMLSQVDAQHEVREKAYLSIVAIGPLAEVKYKGEKLVSSEVGESPPHTVLAQFGKNEEKVRIAVGHNKVPPFVELDSAEPVELSRKTLPNKEEYEAIAKIEGLAPTSILILILRPQGAFPKLWEESPKLNFLKIDPLVTASSNTLVVNYSKKKLQLEAGGIKLVIKPEKIHTLKFESKESAYLNCEVKDVLRENKLLAQTTLALTKNRLNVIIFYDANPKTNRGKSIGVVQSQIVVPSDVE